MEEHYVIISGTNRKESNTYKIASIYQQELEKKNIRADLLSLENLDLSGRNTGYIEIEKKLLLPTAKFIFIIPEYNASFPGVLKTLLDLSDYKNVWWGKKALLTGISSGRSGNVRGMEHLTSILHYLKVVVHPNKLPISGVHNLLNGSATIQDAQTLRVINEQLDEFIKF
ncbi:MAG TPA: NAD(P)H-dependent oxidoreductase [Flavitalea sp.]|nr:NAD(P)H-dependent oxidoreductase [Flavitalea sp.]